MYGRDSSNVHSVRKDVQWFSIVTVLLQRITIGRASDDDLAKQPSQFEESP